MKKNSTNGDPKKQSNILEGFDPMVPCAWLPAGEVRLSEYNKMVTHFVQKRLAEKDDAQHLCFKEQPIRPK